MDTADFLMLFLVAQTIHDWSVFIKVCNNPVHIGKQINALKKITYTYQKPKNILERLKPF